MRRIARASAALLLVGCAVNTDPVLGNADAGVPGADAGLAAGPFEAVVPYAGCDVDLQCTTGCDEDLDCSREGLAGADEDDIGELADEASMVMGEAAEAWFALGTPERSQGIEAQVDAGAVILAAYDDADRLVARGDGLIVVPAAMAAQRLRLRVVAMPGASVDLARTWLPQGT